MSWVFGTLNTLYSKGLTISSPLHGIPILIKNNIATDDLMNNTGLYTKTNRKGMATDQFAQLVHSLWSEQRYLAIRPLQQNFGKLVL